MSCVVCGRALERSYYFGGKGPYCQEHFEVAKCYAPSGQKTPVSWIGKFLKNFFLGGN